MNSFMTKHQIAKEIFYNIYGEYPINPVLDTNVKHKFDCIRRQVSRTLKTFSKLFNFQYQEFCPKDFYSSNSYHHQQHSIDKAIATLTIIEVTYRFLESSRQLNINRTKIAGYIVHHQWHKINTDSLGVFFYPFFRALEEQHPNFEKEFKEKFIDNCSINDELFLYMDKILLLIASK